MKIADAIRLNQEGSFVGPGWVPIVDAALRKIEKHYAPYNEVFQIKEKFGGLRIYCDKDATDEINAIIQKAEKLAFMTCEVCGKQPASPRDSGWIKTLCDFCDDERNTARRERMARLEGQ